MSISPGVLGITAIILIGIITIAVRRSLNRTCSICGRARADKGSHFACTVCDFDPDLRPRP